MNYLSYFIFFIENMLYLHQLFKLTLNVFVFTNHHLTLSINSIQKFSSKPSIDKNQRI